MKPEPLKDGNAYEVKKAGTGVLLYVDTHFGKESIFLTKDEALDLAIKLREIAEKLPPEQARDAFFQGPIPSTKESRPECAG